MQAFAGPLKKLLPMVALIVALGCVACSPLYVVRAGIQEARILSSRRPIARVVEDPSTTAETRHKLDLVLQARAYASHRLDLDAGDSYTTFAPVAHDTLLMVISASAPDRFAPYTWWFPIVGRVPYKGYFDVGDARHAAEALKKDGFDVYLRPASAFSTLGWFNDPLVSTTLRADSIDLVNTVIHELTHNTYYAPGGATFNESFANFVGSRGAARFFRSRGSVDAAEEAEARWSDEKLMASFWGGLYKTVDSAFKAHPGDENRSRRIAVRDTIYRDARETLSHQLGPKFRVIGPHVLERIRIDNAAVMARRVYLTDVDLFDQAWVKQRYDLRATIERVIAIARGDKDRKPFAALRSTLGK
jgi:predicted aminopeptidase